MGVGKQLKEARMAAKLTQEKVAEEVQVSRQTISNWENEKSYPDIISVIKLSDMYGISLDVLLKEDNINLVKHLEENTNVVKSNRNLIAAFMVNAILMILLAVLGNIFAGYTLVWVCLLIVVVISTGAIFTQIIRRF